MLIKLPDMKKTRHLFYRIPEIILFAETLIYWYYSSPLNLIAMALLLILLSLFIFINKTTGLAISTLFLSLNLYMCLALASELSEFQFMTRHAKLMLLVFGTMFGIGIIASTLLLVKWVKNLAADIQIAQDK